MGKPCDRLKKRNIKPFEDHVDIVSLSICNFMTFISFIHSPLDWCRSLEEHGYRWGSWQGPPIFLGDSKQVLPFTDGNEIVLVIKDLKQDVLQKNIE